MDGDESSDDGGRADDVFEDLARERQSAVVGVHGWEGARYDIHERVRERRLLPLSVHDQMKRNEWMRTYGWT